MRNNINEKELFIEYVKRLIFDGKFDELLNMEEDVIGRNIVELSYWYASKVKGADIATHEDIVCFSKDLVWISSFMRDVKNANISRLDNIIIDSGDPYYNYITATIPKIDIKKHGMAIFLSGDPEYNYLFAKDIKGADIKLHEKAVALSENERFISKFMKNIPGADLNVLSKAVIKGENPYWNYVIARDYDVNVLEHGDVIYKSLIPEYIKLFDELIKSKSAKRLIREKND
ncbi:MAG: hypothetical protein VZS44_03830 [Bacilli bacterium]|nr:hypothetical protein [Bacilli bacterium]